VNFLRFYEGPCYTMLGADPPDFGRFAGLCDLSLPCPRATFQGKLSAAQAACGIEGKMHRNDPKFAS
jgi:hypothetical protein